MGCASALPLTGVWTRRTGGEEGCLAGQPGNKGVAQVVAQPPGIPTGAQQGHCIGCPVSRGHPHPCAGHGGCPMQPKHLLHAIHHQVLSLQLQGP